MAEFEKTFREPVTPLEEKGVLESPFTRTFTKHEKYVYTDGRETCFPSTDENTTIGTPETFHLSENVPLCHLRNVIPSRDSGEIIVMTTENITNHILVCTGSYNVFFMLCSLRYVFSSFLI
jgi:hypothetical protein